MVDKSAEQLFHEFRGNALADVTMSLLRSRHALEHLALMASHLGDGQIVDQWLGSNFVEMFSQLGWGLAPVGEVVPERN